MSHMNVAGWIGEHNKVVELLLGTLSGAEQAFLYPVVLPFLLYFVVVRLHFNL